MSQALQTDKGLLILQGCNNGAHDISALIHWGRISRRSNLCKHNTFALFPFFVSGFLQRRVLPICAPIVWLRCHLNVLPRVETLKWLSLPTAREKARPLEHDSGTNVFHTFLNLGINGIWFIREVQAEIYFSRGKTRLAISWLRIHNPPKSGGGSCSS